MSSDQNSLNYGWDPEEDNTPSHKEPNPSYGYENEPCTPHNDSYGYPVTTSKIESVFGRQGIIEAKSSDYSKYYQALSASLTEFSKLILNPNSHGYLTWDGNTLAISSGGQAGTGTVTSVTLNAPSNFTVTGSPITGFGTLTFAWNGSSANFILADGSTVATSTYALASSLSNYATIAALSAYQPLNSNLSAISALSGLGLLRKTGTNTWTLDTTSYLTPTSNAATASKLLSPVNISGVSFDGSSSINLTSDNISEGSTNQYFTASRVLTSPLTGYSLGTNTAISALDNIISAFGKIQSQINNIQPSNPILQSISSLSQSQTGLIKLTNGVASLDSNVYALSSQLSSYQPLDADLTSIAGLSGTSGLLRKTAANTWSLDTNTYLTANQTITVSGDASGSGSSSISLTVGKILGVTIPAVSTGNLRYNGSALIWDATSYLTSNQSIAWTASGDVSGSASGSTAISPALIVTGIQGKSITLATGFLKYNGTAWSFDNSSYQPLATNLTTLAALGNPVSNGYVLSSTTAGVMSWIPVAGGGGTVTSVGLTAPTLFTVSGSPVTTNGSLSFAWNGSNLNFVLADGSTVSTSTYALASALSSYLTTANASSTYLTITNASTTYQPLDADLTSIAGLAGTSGLLKKTAANTWTLDTSSYLTGNQSITLTASGDISGSASGSTSITPSLTVTGIQGKSITLASGLLRYNGTSFSFDSSAFITLSSLSASGAITYNSGTGAIAHSTADGYLHVPATGTTNNGKVLTAGSTAGSLSWITPNNGTVTSVGLTVPNIFTVSGPPVTTSGNLSFAWNGTSTNFVLADGSTVATSTYTLASALSSYLTISAAATTYQPLDGDLTSIAGLAGTSGLARKTAANTWSLDTNTYLTGNQSVTWTASGDVSGSASGSTSISPSLTVTAIQGKSITLATGFLKYNGTAWVFDNSTYLTTSSASSTYQPLSTNLTTLSSLGNPASNGYVLSSTTAGVMSWIPVTGGGGTVTSVALSAPTIFTVSGSPITTNGTLSFVWNGSSTNFVLADGSTVAVSNYLTTSSASSTYQPLDADLTSIAGLSGTSGLLKKTAANTWSLDTNTYLTDNQTITLSGDVTGSGSTSITTTVGKILNTSIPTIASGNLRYNGSALIWDSTSYAPTASPSFTGTVTLPTSLSGTLIASSGVVSSLSGSNLVLGSGSTIPQSTFVLSSTNHGIESTGIYSWVAPCLSTASSTSFNITAVSGQIVDTTTTPGTPIITQVNYAGASNVTDLYVSTSIVTYLYLDSTGTLKQTDTALTATQRRSHIYLGIVAHPTLTAITSFDVAPDICTSVMSQTRELWSAINTVNYGITAYANGSNLYLNISGGYLSGLGINWKYDVTNPMHRSIGPYTAVSFKYRLQTGYTYSSTTLIDPTKYDNSGVLTTIGGATGSATNKRIYTTTDGQILIQYGQTVYSTLAAAVAAASTESVILPADVKPNLTLIGILSVRKTATALNDITQAIFLNASKFGEISGGSAGTTTATLQGVYDNSSIPHIITSSTIGPVTLRRGTAADTDAVLSIQDGSSNQNFYVTGAGIVNSKGLVLNEFVTGTLINTSGAVSALSGTNIVLGNGSTIAQSTFQLSNSILSSISGVSSSSTGLLKLTSGVASLDTSTYLTTNQTITLSGDVTGSGTTAITSSISASIVTGKILTGYTLGTNSTIGATDSILTAFGKIQAQINATLGTVTSVGLSTPSIFTVSGSPVTTSGSLSFSWNGASTNFVLADGSTVARSTYLTANQSITLTGAVTGTGSTAITTSLASNVVGLSNLSNLAANSVIGNLTGSSATPTAISAVTTPTASTVTIRDGNANILANNLVSGYTTTVTSAGTTTLTASSTHYQFFTGTTTQTVILPDVSTLTLGHTYTIFNNSTNTVTVKTSGSNIMDTLYTNTSVAYTCILTTGTNYLSWSRSASWGYNIYNIIATPNAIGSLTNNGGGVFSYVPTLALTGGTLSGKLILPASTISSAPLNIPQGIAPTSPVNGDIWNTTAGTFVQVAGSTLKLNANGALYYSNTVPFYVGNTTTPTSLGSTLLSSAAMTPGNVISIKADGAVQYNVLSDYVTITLRVGGTDINFNIAGTSVPSAIINTYYHWRFEGQLSPSTGPGAGSSLKFSGKFSVVGVGAEYVSDIRQTITADTSSAITFDLRVTWSATGAANSIGADYMVVQQINSIGGGGGSVMSVALSAPSLFTVSGSPITSSGTLGFSWNGSSANLVNADGTTTAKSSLEPSLGNPGTNGYVLSSTTAGVRSWVAMTSGGFSGTTTNGIAYYNGTTLTNASTLTYNGSYISCQGASFGINTSLSGWAWFGSSAFGGAANYPGFWQSNTTGELGLWASTGTQISFAEATQGNIARINAGGFYPETNNTFNLGTSTKAWANTYTVGLTASYAVFGYQSITTAAATSTLTASSPCITEFTGTTTQTCVLPNATTLVVGRRIEIDNNSTGLVTIQTNGGSTLLILAAGTVVTLTCTSIATAAGTWKYDYIGLSAVSGKKLTINNTITLAGTDGTIMTFPATSSSIARTDAAQTFNGTQSFANNVYFGAGTLTNIPEAPLNMMASASGTLKTQINIINTGGGAGAGAAIDFFTYDVSGGTAPGLRIAALDNSYSADFVVYTKVPNAAGNALAERFRITNAGVGTLPGGLTCSAGGIGYATGAGGTVSQGTSKSTGVTLSKLCGTITMNAAALANATTVSFTLTNTFIAANDFVMVQHTSAGTLGAYAFAVAPAAGRAVISVRNVHSASLSEAIVLRFVVIKAVVA